jgi:hypothetical protein
MIEDTLAKIEAAVAKLQASDAAQKTEALRLLAVLKDELSRAERPAKLAPSALDGLARAAKSFEASHPRLAETLVELCRELASLGI